MGCGCKNKGNQAQPSPEQQQAQQEAIQLSIYKRGQNLSPFLYLYTWNIH